MKCPLLLLLSLPLLLSACKKDDNQPKCQTVTHAPQEFLDYWFFPKGSWWVYKLKGSNPAEYDTVRNGHRHAAFFDHPGQDMAGPAMNCEMFYIHDLTHSNKTYFLGTNPHSDYTGGEALISWRFGDKWVVDQAWQAVGHASENIYFFYPFAIGEVHGHYNNWVSDTNAVVTPNYTFNNSVGMFLGYNYNTDTTAYPQRKIYFSKGVGVTWRRYYNGQVWELVNYHISQIE